MLPGALAGLEDGAARAEDAGRAWGRYLVRRPSPLERGGEKQATREVVDLLEEQGFAPEAAPGEIRMRRCPYDDLAETHPQIVCALHRGLMAGAFAELGSGLAVDALDVFVEPDLCVAHLVRPEGHTTER